MGKRREVFIAVQDGRWLSKNSAAAIKPEQGNGPRNRCAAGCCTLPFGTVLHLGRWESGGDSRSESGDSTEHGPNDLLKSCNVIA
jgi:hypothetical protein